MSRNSHYYAICSCPVFSTEASSCRFFVRSSTLSRWRACAPPCCSPRSPSLVPQRNPQPLRPAFTIRDLASAESSPATLAPATISRARWRCSRMARSSWSVAAAKRLAPAQRATGASRASTHQAQSTPASQPTVWCSSLPPPINIRRAWQSQQTATSLSPAPVRRSSVRIDSVRAVAFTPISAT